ncbi:ArsR/SmtB family transcription factor [Deferrisoma camini]|uniref:ArsR/SmtB family transcription factor n=1 Tax=Deferrisoma camini TaxID=1035120 RepID=UPI0004BC8B11|nr:metalloregulator ArsR/SmtB family transcription factor [Deferrisoma camini]
MSRPGSDLFPMLDPCTAKTPVEERPLLDPGEARQVATMFKILANDTRVRLLHALVRTPGLCVGELADDLGMKPQAVSNQLQRLADRGIVEPERRGTQVCYRIVDPCVVQLLSYGLCLAEDAEARRG